MKETSGDTFDAREFDDRAGQAGVEEVDRRPV